MTYYIIEYSTGNPLDSSARRAGLGTERGEAFRDLETAEIRLRYLIDIGYTFPRTYLLRRAR